VGGSHRCFVRIQPAFAFLLWGCFGATVKEAALVPDTASRDAVFAEAQKRAMGGDRTQARALCQRLLAARPDDDEARVLCARLDAWEGRFTEAERGYRAVLARRPGDEEALIGLIDVYLWQRRYGEAGWLIDDGLRALPASAGLLARKARLEAREGDATDARSLASKAHEKAPEDPEIERLWARLATTEIWAIARNDLFPSGYPNLPGLELGVLQKLWRFTLVARTEQAKRLAAVQGGSAYNATYSLGLVYAIAPGWAAAVEGGFGAPATAAPRARVEASLTAPISSWLSVAGAYSYLVYENGVSAHGVRPWLGITFNDDTWLDLRYWFTYVLIPAPGARAASARRGVHALSAQLSRQIVPRLRLSLGYAHGAQIERAPAAFQLLSMTSNAAWLGASIEVSSSFSLRPLYRLEIRSFDRRPPSVMASSQGAGSTVAITPGAEVPIVPIHTLELGAVVRF